ncbi:WD repeat-containing protein 88 [Sciurus carolinensis]|uniref:WD repeat-containing protein 88 n=1 Tax=Sciurus carolinensis TaxID=30640 RepID=A0AA41N7Q7_SCICA|nr:WD repeat-containing protein 88 [Sciurus carolinensis]
MRVPGATTVMKALGRFKMSVPDIYHTRLLASLDPLALDKDTPQMPVKQEIMPEEKVWGDHQPLSKIPFKILSGHEHVVSSCHFCVNDTKLLSSSYDRTVKLWWRINHDYFIVSCKFSPDGKYVALSSDVDHGICIMDAKNTTILANIKDHHRRSIMACCFDPDSQKLASVSLDRSIKIWDVTSKATLLTITQAHENAISNCCFTFSGHFLCSSSWDKNLKIWNVHTGEFRNRGACVTLMQGHNGCVSSCCFARDNSFLISGGFDKSVAIWDVGEGYRKLSLKGHEDWVMDVAISNNKKWILSASKDRTMRLWNIENIDQVPLVIENKKAMGIRVKQCEGCDRPFSTLESDSALEIVTKCIFCRRDPTDLPAESSSSLDTENDED